MGPLGSTPPPAHQRMRKWIEKTRDLDHHAQRTYPTLADAVARMQEANPFLSADMARHLTLHGTNWNAEGELIWKFNSPTWMYSAATYARTAAAFGNPDWETIVIGNYRWRQSLAPAEPEYAELEAQLQKAPKIGVPTITIDGRYDPFTPAGDGSSYRDHFIGRYEHRTFDVGHNVPQEAPREFAQAVVDASR